MNIDFNDALHDMADDEGATAAPRTTADGLLEVEEPTRRSRRGPLLGGLAGLAVLGLAAVALWPGSHDAPATTATPADSLAGTPQLPASTPSAPAASTLSSTSGWRFDATDPAASTLDESLVRSRCAVASNQQVVPRKGTAFHPGSSVLIGPAGAKPPMEGAPSTRGWRVCNVGYHTAPSAAVIGERELSRDPATLKKACSSHSGFTFDARWKVATQDTRSNPRTNNVSDATLAMNGPDGWAVGCEMSAGSDIAALTFLAPDAKDSCISVHAATMQGPAGGPGGPAGAPAGGPGGPGPGHEGPGGALYWVTAFGRVPDVKDLRAKAASGGFNIGTAVESNAMVHVGGGLAVANHTWKPDAATEKKGAPTVHFFDAAGNKLYSCTAS